MFNSNYVAPARCRGFSLLELSMVLVISGLMVSFVLQANQSAAPANDCYVVTKAQLNTIRAAVDRFARKNDRLPVPAARNIGVENIKYGREAVTGTAAVVAASADIDVSGSGATAISYGALPFQALGLSPSFASDCWGNKFSYAVTTALTNNAASGGFLDSTVLGNIAVKSSLTITTNLKAAYSVISHGEDGIGAVRTNYSATNPAHAWCVGMTALKHLNCNIVGAVADAAFNNGKDAGANYFDDIIVAAGKPQMLPQMLASGTSNLSCWGSNTYGQLGNGTTTQSNQPIAVSGTTQYAQVSLGLYHTCALDTAGKAYCWGLNQYNRFRTGGVGANSTTPVAVATAYTFSQIIAADTATCGITTAGKAYCWGATPTAVDNALTFKMMSGGYDAYCGVLTNGEGRCWGYNAAGVFGNNSTTSNTVPQVVHGSHTFKTVRTSYYHSCGVAVDNTAWCWGRNGSGELGKGGAYGGQELQPVAVVDGLSFRDVYPGQDHTCGLTITGQAYCWGANDNGQLGIAGLGAYWPMTRPQLVNGGYTFSQLVASYRSTCGLTTDNKVYCWGTNGNGQLGKGSAGGISDVPFLIKDGGVWPNVFGVFPSSIDITTHHCAIQPLPPASWGDNSSYQVGDTTTTARATPTYMTTLGTGVNYFTAVSGNLDHKCGLDKDGNAWCWGSNGDNQIGNGTTGGTKSVPTASTMPGTTFKSIISGRYGNCAIGMDNQPYCWGSYVGFGGSNKSAPTLLPVPPSPTVTKIKLWQTGGIVLGSNNQAYEWSGTYGAPALASLSGTSLTSVKDVAAGDSITCIIGNDDWVYCKGISGTFSAIGDGSTSGTVTDFTPVTNPGILTGFKSVSVGSNGGGWSFTCAIGNDDKVYCWGNGGNGMVGNGLTNDVYIPTEVTMPAGGTAFSNLNVDYKMVTALGNDGVYYYWGMLDGSTGATNTPIKLPPPPGVNGYTSISSGRIGLVR